MRTKEIEQGFILNQNREIFHCSITIFVKTKIRRTVDTGAQSINQIHLMIMVTIFKCCHIWNPWQSFNFQTFTTGGQELKFEYIGRFDKYGEIKYFDKWIDFFRPTLTILMMYHSKGTSLLFRRGEEAAPPNSPPSSNLENFKFVKK